MSGAGSDMHLGVDSVLGEITVDSQVWVEGWDGGSVSVCPEGSGSGSWEAKCEHLLKSGMMTEAGLGS